MTVPGRKLHRLHARAAPPMVPGVFLAIAMAFSAFTLLAVAMFRRGTWKEKVV